MAAVPARESGKPRTRERPGRSYKEADCLKACSVASVWTWDDQIPTCSMRKWKLGRPPGLVARNKLRERLLQLRRPRPAQHRLVHPLRMQSDRVSGAQTTKVRASAS